RHRSRRVPPESARDGAEHDAAARLRALSPAVRRAADGRRELSRLHGRRTTDRHAAGARWGAQRARAGVARTSVPDRPARRRQDRPDPARDGHAVDRAPPPDVLGGLLLAEAARVLSIVAVPVVVVASALALGIGAPTAFVSVVVAFLAVFATALLVG